MPEKTAIAWTDSTFNIAWGCIRVSPGCANCYAEVLASRFRPKKKLWGAGSERLTFGESHWRKPLTWNRKAEREGRRHRVFCSSIADNFEDHPTILGELPKLWELIRRTPSLDWQLLTKRSDRISLSLPQDWGYGYPNVWLGVSIENMEYSYRADDLRCIPAAVRFISYEPALGPLDGLNLDGIDWVIYGGESGAGFRKDDREWSRRMYKQDAHLFTERGTTLDGVSIKEYPVPRCNVSAA